MRKSSSSRFSILVIIVPLCIAILGTIVVASFDLPPPSKTVERVIPYESLK